MPPLPAPDPGEEARWVQVHLAELVGSPVHRSTIRGGQTAADTALASFDVAGYASSRNEVWPSDRRGASRLSPYIRHGLLSLPTVWQLVRGPRADVAKFRDELLWQEYARHLYARLGSATGSALRYAVADRGSGEWPQLAGGMACLEAVFDELDGDGWLPNQARMWVASHWAVRQGRGWRDGEDAMFRRLLDGSRAANRLGWQWTAGALTGSAYGFSRSQVERRAPGMCGTCDLRSRCPVEQWPDPPAREPLAAVDPRMRRGAADEGPPAAGGEAEQVWLTAESLGDDDPALAAHPALPAVFVWDLPLLRRLQLRPQRLVFLAECLADLSQRRALEIRAGDPAEELSGRRLAATRAPVPGWRSRAARLRPVDVLEWPWLVSPHDGSVTSFTAWRRRAGV